MRIDWRIHVGGQERFREVHNLLLRVEDEAKFQRAIAYHLQYYMHTRIQNFLFTD